MSSIELVVADRRVLLPVTILPPDTGFNTVGMEGMALLDTGAMASGIRSTIADSLGLRSIGKRPLVSAQGIGHADRYIFRIGIATTSSSSTPTFPFIFSEIIGFSLHGDASFDAILGMDILSQCDLRLNRNGTGSLTFG
jgi:hypothetical protein